MMTWTVRQRGHEASARARIFGMALCVIALAGCQSASSTSLPAGQAGYNVMASAPAPNGEGVNQLRAGDVISVRVFGEDDLSSETVTIDAAGAITLPLIGEIVATGLSSRELATRIETAYASKYLRDPRVVVGLLQTAANMITVEGEVEQPGSYPHGEGSTLLVALAQAQSPTDIAALDEVVVFRTVEGQRYGGMFDVNAIRAGRMPDLALQPGDLIVVGRSGGRAALRALFRSTPLLGVLRPI